MTTTSTTPYDWLKSIEPSLVGSESRSVDDIPEQFSWEELSRRLGALFESPTLSIRATKSEWLAGAERLHGLEAPPVSLQFAVGELLGTAYWVLSSSSSAQLMAAILTGHPTAVTVPDAAFQEGFLRYLISEVIFLLNELGLNAPLIPRYLGSQELPADERSYCIDLTIAIEGHSYLSRLLLSQALAASWREHFVRAGKKREISASLAQKTDLIIHLEAGRVALSQAAWSKVQPGDFVLLDTCTVIPGVDKGRVMMTTGGIPLFRAMLKKEQIKILEHPLYHEVETSMSDETEDSEHEEKEESSELEDEPGEGEEGEEGDDLLEGEEELAEQEDEADDAHEEHARTSSGGAHVAIEQIPVTLVVEVGRLKISLAKLRELQPGNLLDLDVRPEEGVDLVINGRSVGRGELLRVGESLGVRVLEIG